DEHRDLPHRGPHRRGRAAVLLPPLARRGALRRRHPSAARELSERRRDRGRHAPEPPSRGLHSVSARAVLVDPPAIQGTARAVSRRVRGLAARGMTASTGDDLSLARFRAPRYWPTWILLGALKLVAKLPFPVQLALGRGLCNAL